MRKLTAFICMMTMCLTPCSAFAADMHAGNADPQGLTAARSLDEFIELTEPDLDDASFDVNKNTGRITGTDEDLSFREAFGTSFSEVKGSKGAVKQAINEAEGYQVAGESKNKIHVTSDYGLKRILVNGVLTDTWGAENAVTYDGQTLLTFGSTEATKEAFRDLVNAYGAKNVLLDQIISIEEDTATADLTAAEDPQGARDEITPEDEPAAPAEDQSEDQLLEAADDTAPDADLTEDIDLQITGDDPTVPAGDTESEGDFKGWGTSFMGLDYELQQYEDFDETIVVAVLDTGINEAHEIFDDTTIAEDSRGFVGDESDITDRYYNKNTGNHGHGTKVSGIIAESTPSNVELLVLKVLDDNGSGTIIRMLQALDYAAEHDADIVNMSFGNNYQDKDIARKYEAFGGATIDRHLSDIASRDILLCTAAGNNGADMDQEGYNFYPAESPYTIAVGSITEAGKHVSSSNYGNNLDFAAPGNKLTLASSEGTQDYEAGSGTSYACPYISACAAYLLMYNSEHTPDTIREQLRLITDPAVTGTSSWHKYFGYGMPKYTEATVLMPVDLSGDPKVKASSCEYDGSVKIPELTVTYMGDVMASYDVEPVTDCTSIGPQKVRITLRGNYEKPITATGSFKIVPHRVELGDTCTVYMSGQKMGFNWSESPDMSKKGYYQIQISTKKSFSKYKSYKVAGLSTTINNLKAGKIYYVRVRACDKVGSKTYYSPWSTVKSYKNKY